MTREKEVTEKGAPIIDQSVGDKKTRRRPKTICPPPGSGTSRQFMIQDYTKNIPIERPSLRGLWVRAQYRRRAIAFRH